MLAVAFSALLSMWNARKMISMYGKTTVIGKPSASLLTRAFKDERKIRSNGLTGPAPAFGSQGARGCGCSLRSWTYRAVDGVAFFVIVRFAPLSIWPFLIRTLPNGMITWARTSFG